MLQTCRPVTAALVLCLLAFAGIDRATVRAADADPVVQTGSGRVRGVRLPEGGAAFRGIPFAAPPVGALRWQPPAPPAAWSGVRDATAFSAACAQPLLGDWNKTNAENGREDCLYLNVVTPTWPAKTPLPVMVWIHGGGNMGGTGATPFFAAGGLERRGVILVTINYRLDVFGFFAHPALRGASPHHSSGNYGLLDQIAALAWVRDNIARFGGDPRNVTVFGQSAGAIDMAALMASPLATGLFQKAISQSGSITRHPTPAAELEAAGARWAQHLPVPAGQDPLTYLRGLDAAALLAAAKSKDGPGLPVEQALDGWVLLRTPAEAFHDGRQAPVPMIVGHTSRELPVTKPADGVRADIERGVPADHKARVLSAYGLADGGPGLPDDPVLGTLSVQFIVDVQFRCTGYLQRTWVEAAKQAAYGYQFDRTPPGRGADGAQHSAELPYVFGSFPAGGNIGGAYDDADRRLSDVMQRYWTNFAKTGDPNGPGLPAWPRFGTAQGAIEFLPDGTAVARPGFRRTQCEAFRAAVESEPIYRR